MNYLNEGFELQKESLPTGNFDCYYKFPRMMSGEIIRVAKKNLLNHTKFPYLNQHGIYILKADKYYIGKADTQNLYNRIRQHIISKDPNIRKTWWCDDPSAELICIIDTHGSLDSGRLGYLESKLINLSKTNNNDLVDNSNVPKFNILQGDEFWLGPFFEDVCNILSKLNGYNKIISYEDENLGSKTMFQKMIGFINSWAYDPVRYNQYRRRNGWTFRPSHGDLNQEKLEELQEWLTGMFYDNEDVEFICDLYNIDRIRKEFNLYPNKLDHTMSSDELFIRQQKNYMDKLELIKRVGGRNSYRYVLTDRGKRYLNSPVEDLYKFLVAALEYYRWFDIEVRQFVREAMQYLRDSNISEDEFMIFLSHGGVRDYIYYRPIEIAQFIERYRKNSDDSERSFIKNYAESMINKVDKSRSQTSYQRISGAQCKEAMHDILGNDLFNDHSKLLRQYKREKYFQEKFNFPE